MNFDKFTDLQCTDYCRAVHVASVRKGGQMSPPEILSLAMAPNIYIFRQSALKGSRPVVAWPHCMQKNNKLNYITKIKLNYHKLYEVVK